VSRVAFLRDTSEREVSRHDFSPETAVESTGGFNSYSRAVRRGPALAVLP
jgi:hypothetical protein